MEVFVKAKHSIEYKCVLLETFNLDYAENQLNKLFEDGWQFHSVFTVGLDNDGTTAEYAVVYR